MDYRFRSIQKDLVFEGKAEEFDYSILTDGSLSVRAFGCHSSHSDAVRLFFLLKGKVKNPTLIIFPCNVTNYFKKLSLAKIKKFQEEWPSYKIFIVGCINKYFENEYKKYGTLVSRKDMWNLENYEVDLC